MRDQPTEGFTGSIWLGALALATLGPIAVGGAFILIAAFLAAFWGVEVSWLAQKTPLDLLYDPGFRGVTLAHFVAFMAGGVSAVLATAGIWWAFTGRSPGS